VEEAQECHSKAKGPFLRISSESSLLISHHRICSFFGQQQQMAGAGMFPGPFSPQQQQNGAFNGDGRLMGSPTGFGGLNTGEPDDGEEDEQEEFRWLMAGKEPSIFN
jgi:hypothetical protein